MVQDSAWSEDYLEREKFSHDLERYILYKKESILYGDKGFVLSVNAGWGTGKTFFLTNWHKDLRDRKYLTVYYDAWQDDISNEPLLSFISEFDQCLHSQLSSSKKAQEALSDAVDVARKISWSVMPALIGLAIKQFTGVSVEELRKELERSGLDVENTKQDIISEYADISSTYLLNDHEERKKSIKDFKEKFSRIISKVGSMTSVNLPIFIFVDELDRCRPDFALEVLENIKHLFDLPGACFIVATDKEQLAYSIKSVYGDRFDSQGYLRRFFDRSIHLPEPSYYGFSKLVFNEFRIKIPENSFFPDFDIANEYDKWINVFAEFSRFFNFSLRDQKQAGSELDSCLVFLSKQVKNLHVAFLLYLICLKIADENVFAKIEYFKGKDFLGNLSTSDSSGFVFPKPNSRSGVEVQKYSVRDVINAYHACEGISLKSNTPSGWHGVIVKALQRELPSSFPQGDREPAVDFSVYLNAVRHATLSFAKQ